MRTRRYGLSARLAPFILAAASSCAFESVDEASDETSEPGTLTQAVSSLRMIPPGINTASSDFGVGWGCMQKRSSSSQPLDVRCFAVGETYGPKVAVDLSSGVSNLPANGLKYEVGKPPMSLAVSNPVQGNATLYLLGSDNVVRRSSGRPLETAASWSNRKYFQTFHVAVQALTTTNQSACVRQIVNVGLPAYYGANRLMALSCSGALYLQEGDRWAPINSSSPAPFNAIPANSAGWLGISRGGKVGAYLLDAGTDKRIYQVGAGTYDYANLKPLYDNRWLPALPSGLKPTHTGGTFVLTNAGDGTCTFNEPSCPGDDNRVYRFDSALNRWVKPSGRLVPNPNIGANGTTPPWSRVVDGAGFGNHPERYFVWVPWGQLWEAVP